MGRASFALWHAMRHAGGVIWIAPARDPSTLMAQGLPEGVGPRLTLIRAGSEEDLLWATEESLRGLPGALVIARPEKPLSLTAGRRLQLAAEAGGTTGLMLIADGAGSPATETRWSCRPGPPCVLPGSGDSTLHQWSLIKNKRGTSGEWTLDWDGTSSAFDLVAATGKRDGASRAAG